MCELGAKEHSLELVYFSFTHAASLFCVTLSYVFLQPIVGLAGLQDRNVCETAVATFPLLRHARCLMRKRFLQNNDDFIDYVAFLSEQWVRLYVIVSGTLFVSVVAA